MRRRGSWTRPRRADAVSGVRITATFSDAEFAGALHRLQLTPAKRTAILRAIGVGLVATTQDRFRAGQDPWGRAWRPLNTAYAAAKRGPGILREAGMRGGLEGSITFATTGSSVVVGSNKIYAAVHQFGATIRAKNGRGLVFRIGTRTVFARSVTVPARPYLGFGLGDQEVVMDALDVLLPGGRA